MITILEIVIPIKSYNKKIKKIKKKIKFSSITLLLKFKLILLDPHLSNLSKLMIR